MGLAFDQTCELWQNDCGIKGSCLFYETQDLAFKFFLICFTVKLISLLAMIMASVFYNPPKMPPSLEIEVVEETFKNSDVYQRSETDNQLGNVIISYSEDFTNM